MTLNITQLQTDLQTRLNALVGTESDESILALTAAVNNITQNRIISVQNYRDLPNLTTNPLPSGSLVLVKQLNVMMMSVGTQWRGVDGRVYIPPQINYGWGNNNSGRLGDGTGTYRSSPVTVVGGITSWSWVSAGYQYSLGVTRTGIAYGWGGNSQGSLGDNTTVGKSSPVTVVGGITNWIQVAAGYRQSLGVTSTGIAYGWGGNGDGQVGDNTTVGKSSPVTVVGGITNWIQVAAGSRHSLGITSTGIAYGWGANGYGQVGNNTATSSPVTVVSGVTNWSQIEGGYHSSLGITSTGIAYGWGANGYGQVGDGTTTNRLSPVTVIGGITNWSHIACSFRHSLGITSTGIAYGWGYNFNGQLGDNTTSNRSSPVTIVGGITTWARVAPGSVVVKHSIGITSTGIAYGWGFNNNGQVGDNTTTDRSSPVTVVGGITTWIQAAAGSKHSMALAVQ